MTEAERAIFLTSQQLLDRCVLLPVTEETAYSPQRVILYGEDAPDHIPDRSCSFARLPTSLRSLRQLADRLHPLTEGVNLGSLARLYEVIRKKHVHRWEPTETPADSIGRVLEWLSDPAFDPGRKQIDELIKDAPKAKRGSRTEETEHAVFLLNHLLVNPEGEAGTEAGRQRMSDKLHECYLDAFTRHGCRVYDKVDRERAYFNVLLVDDFFFLHLHQMAVLETQFLAGVSEPMKGEGVCLAPVIHFDFECLPSRVEDRLKRKEYDLVLLDIDFGDLPGGSNKVFEAARAKGIPVVVFSKRDVVDYYERFMGGALSAIRKDAGLNPEKLFVQLLRLLLVHHEVMAYECNGWVVLKSAKLGRLGLYKLPKGEKLLDLVRALIPVIETAPKRLSQRVVRPLARQVLTAKPPDGTTDFRQLADDMFWSDGHSTEVSDAIAAVQDADGFSRLRDADSVKRLIAETPQCLHLVLPDQKDGWTSVLAGQVPEFVSGPKYRDPVLKRLKCYGARVGDIGKTEHEAVGDLTVEWFTVSVAGPEPTLPSFKVPTASECAGEKAGNLFVDFVLGLEKDLHYIAMPRFSPMSLLDIVGPVTVGPSSSHTAGANRIARLARNLALAWHEKRKLAQIVVEMVNTFNDTGEGHGSDRAIAAGLLGLRQYDPRLPEAIKGPGRNGANLVRGSKFPELSGRDGHIKLRNDLVKVDYYWNEKGDSDVHENALRFHLYGEGDGTWTRDSKEPPTGRVVMTAQSWGGGNVQLCSVLVAGNPVQVKFANKTELFRFTEEQLKVDRTRFSGKDDVTILVPRGDETIELTVGSVFGTNLRDVAHVPDGGPKAQDGEPLVVESPVDGSRLVSDIQAELGNGATGEQLQRARTRYEWVAARPVGAKCRSVPRPDFLTLDDLIDLARKSKLPDIAKAYELWKWHEGDRNRRMLIHKDFLAETFAGYRKLMLQVTERAVKPGVESFTGYRQSNASEFVDKVGSEWGKLPISTRAVVYAMGVNEINAKMAGPILAAPTAGACGIVPGVLRALHDSTAQEDGDKASRLEHREVEGLMIAALIGLVINNVVPTAGATHGCQAECGTGAAMAAAMAVHILGGEAEACINAAALALKNSLGLVCDPLGGRVEVPCIKRAGMKAGEAVEAATLAMHGVTSAIPPSDVVRAMEEIGDNLLSIYKETSRGGLAITPMGRGNQAAAGLAGCEEE